MKNASKLVALVMALVILLCVGGVFATWQYADGRVAQTDSTANLVMGTWGVSELPDGGEEGGGEGGEETGGSQAEIVEKITNELNDETSTLSQNLVDRLEGENYILGNLAGGLSPKDHYGSMDNNQDALGNIVGDADVSIIVQARGNANDPYGEFDEAYINDYTVMYAYTTEVYLGTAGTSGLFGNRTPGSFPEGMSAGDFISPVYRTLLVRATPQSDWEVVVTQKGQAPLCWYSENRILGGTNASQIPSFDIYEWEILIGE